MAKYIYVYSCSNFQLNIALKVNIFFALFSLVLHNTCILVFSMCLEAFVNNRDLIRQDPHMQSLLYILCILIILHVHNLRELWADIK